MEKEQVKEMGKKVLELLREEGIEEKYFKRILSNAYWSLPKTRIRKL